MLRTSVRRSAVVRIAFATILAIGAPLVADITGTALAQATPLAADQSDPVAILTMKNVLAQSGGEPAWRAIRSAEESFTVTRESITAAGAARPTSTVSYFLDDWSLDSTRYRRGVQGMQTPPRDHNGASTFKFKFRNDEDVPEADQARVLATHLPAAAVEVMLRRPEYVLKTTNKRPCATGQTCVDVFRKQGANEELILEQQWAILQTTGLPGSVRLKLYTFGSPAEIWQEIRFDQYDTQSNLRIPSHTVSKSSGGPSETRVLLAITFNQGFNTAEFDQKVAK